MRQSLSARTTIAELENSFTTMGVPEGTVKHDGMDMFIERNAPGSGFRDLSEL